MNDHGPNCLCRWCLITIEDNAARSRAHVDIATRKLDASRERYERANAELERAFIDGEDAQTRATVKP